MEKLNNRTSAVGRPVSLFIGGLPPETTTGDIERWASRIGGDFSIDFEAKKAWASVHFNCLETTEDTLAGPYYMRGRRIDCQIAVEKEEKTASILATKRRKVFVNKLPLTATERDLYQALSIHGELRNVYIVIGKGNSSTLCYAEYLNRNQAKKAIKFGITYNGRRHRVYKYRTIDELQRNYEIRLDKAIEGTPDSQSKRGIDVISSMEYLDPDTPSKNKNPLDFNLPQDSPTNATVIDHFWKPCSKVFFSEKRSPLSTYTSDNLLFRIKTDLNKNNTYKRCEVNSTILYLKLHQVLTPSRVDQGVTTTKLSDIPLVMNLKKKREGMATGTTSKPVKD